jgi:thiamine-monophosphate kinase
MKLAELGEFGLIDVLADLVDAEGKYGEAWSNLVIGIGDDAAAWRCRSGNQLATIDAQVENVHFKLGLTSWEELGWKSLAVNISDIAAMGGFPRYALVSLALPTETDVNDILYFYQGMLNLARELDVAVVGGNISRAPLVVINITVFGDSPGTSPQLLTRSSAEPGDKIVVTGYPGTAAAGFEMLTADLRFNTEATATLRQAFLKPSHRVKEGRILVKCGVKTGIDISDGLVSDLSHICKASALGARIRVESVPVAPLVKANFAKTALQKALSGGEDYELLFTASPDIVDNVLLSLEEIGCPATVIGDMVPDPEAKVVLLKANDKEYKLPRSGWDHFTREK